MANEYRIPVIVGVGEISAGPKSAYEDSSVLDLMDLALQRADADAQSGWLASADFLGIENQISSEVAAWPGDEPITPHLTSRLGIAPSRTLLTKEPSGDGPIYLLDTVAQLIASGEISTAALVGAEALRTAARRAARTTASGGGKRDVMRDLLDGAERSIAQRYGLLTPTDIYPLYESATRAAWGQDLYAAQDETARIWSGFSYVAAHNEHAWIRNRVAPDVIREVSSTNRMITFPYTKLMVANSAVDQGAALIVTSLGLARERGLSGDQIIFIGAGAAAHESEDILARDSYSRSPAMAASIAGALQANGLAAEAIDMVELYSCFPCVVKMARRELGWPVEQPASVYGGLTFGGGPIGNCMMHATAAMVRKLREGGRYGLIFANGGFATHNHTIVLARTQFSAPLARMSNVQAEADRLRQTIPPFDPSYVGPGRIEALSVPFQRDGTPDFATIIARAPDGRRFLARVPQTDTAALAFLTSGITEPVGSTGYATLGSDGLAHWHVEMSE